MRDTSNEIEEIRETLRDSQRGSRNNAIRARYHGSEDDKLAQKYLDRAQSMPELTPPEDEGICALWVGGLPPDAPGHAQTRTPGSLRRAIAVTPDHAYTTD